MNKVKRLHWDSDFFGYTIGHLDLTNTGSIPSFEFNQGFDLIYIFSDKELNSERFPECIDIKVNYKRETFTVASIHPNIEVYEGETCKDLIDLAVLSGHQSRFKKDTKLNPWYEKLYTLWIENSVNKKIADAVLVYKIADTIVGLITLANKHKYVQIGLLSVSDLHWGKGIGSSLLNAIPIIFPEKAIMVSTQFDNEGARALYKKNNYSIHSKQYIYHLWK